MPSELVTAADLRIKKSISIRYKAARHDFDDLKKKKHNLEQCVNDTHGVGLEG